MRSLDKLIDIGFKKMSPPKEEKLDAVLKAVEAINGKIGLMDKKLTEVANSMNQLNGAVQQRFLQSERRLLEMERQLRAKTLLVYGLAEGDDDVETTMLDLLNGQLGLAITADRIDNCFRLPSKAANDDRPGLVILKLLYEKDVIAILKRCNRLKGTTVAISKDLPKPMRLAEKQHWAEIKEARRMKQRISWSAGVLSVAGKEIADVVKQPPVVKRPESHVTDRRNKSRTTPPGSTSGNA